MSNKNLYLPLLHNEIRLYSEARVKNDHNACFEHLSRAHIISQLSWIHHLYVHFLMYKYACSRKDYKEVKGQVLRMIVTIPGHILKKIPSGNIGWTTIGLTETRPIPHDLVKLFE